MVQTFQTWYTSTIALPVWVTDTTITVATAPTVTKGRMKIGRGSVKEWISYTGVSWLVLTGVTRWLSLTADPTTAGTGLSWLAGTTIKLVAMHDQLIDKAYGWNFGDDVSVTGDITATASITAGTYVWLPKYASTWARDTAIPSPTGNELVIVAWNLQHYNSSTAQRETADTGTPVPDLSETVSGKGRYTSDSQYDAGTDTDWSGNALLPKPSQASSTEYLVDKNTYRLGENVTANDSLFAETWPTFAQATSVANIWDVTANTRYEFPIIWDGVAKTTLKLWLKKFVSPSVDLKLRFENDSSWSPSGTLFSWTTEATISSAWLTTSVVDTTVTLAQSTTIPLWTVVWVVLYAGTYWSETINATNYFGIAYSTNDTTTRGRKLWNGSTHSATNTAIFTYISGIGLDTVLSKTDADFAYKIPTDGNLRFAKSTASAWASIPCYNKGIVWGFTSLTNNTLYYLWNTPWSISTSIWTNVFLVGTSMSPTSIYIYDWLRRFFHSTITSSFWAGTTYDLNNKYVKQLVLKYLWTGSVTNWKYFVLTAGDNTFTYKDWGSSPEWTVTRNVNANTVTFINNWFSITPLDMYVEI